MRKAQSSPSVPFSQLTWFDRVRSLWRGRHSDRNFAVTAAYGVDCVLQSSFCKSGSSRSRQGGCHDEAGHIRCDDPRGRWRLLAVEARAADAKTCTGLWDFIETDCQLTW